MSLSEITEILNQETHHIVILSGGEPFEHPQISEILDQLLAHQIFFRIATGGFLNLNKWVEKLSFFRKLGLLDGISLGSDVLTSRVKNSKHSEIWKQNIDLFTKYQIPYSITITLDHSLDFKYFDIFNKSSPFIDLLQFVYLRHPRDFILNKWVEMIRDAFGPIPLITDSYDSI